MLTQRRKKGKSVSGTSGAGRPASKKEFLKDIASGDDDVRTAAWQGAGTFGASVAGPLADLAAAKDLETSRAAKRGLWQIVRICGRPGADEERQTVNRALLDLLSDKRPAQLRRDVLWMLSEIGDDACVSAIAPLTNDADVREDACLALERIPGDASLGALRAALDAAPAGFKPCIAESLRRRGVDVPGVASAKMTPTKTTAVTAL